MDRTEVAILVGLAAFAVGALAGWHARYEGRRARSSSKAAAAAAAPKGPPPPQRFFKPALLTAEGAGCSCPPG